MAEDLVGIYTNFASKVQKESMNAFRSVMDHDDGSYWQFIQQVCLQTSKRNSNKRKKKKRKVEEEIKIEDDDVEPVIFKTSKSETQVNEKQRTNENEKKK